MGLRSWLELLWDMAKAYKCWDVWLLVAVVQLSSTQVKHLVGNLRMEEGL